LDDRLRHKRKKRQRKSTPTVIKQRTQQQRLFEPILQKPHIPNDEHSKLLKTNDENNKQRTQTMNKQTTNANNTQTRHKHKHDKQQTQQTTNTTINKQSIQRTQMSQTNVSARQKLMVVMMQRRWWEEATTRHVRL